ncbi:transposase [Streptomyces chartreusis]|uniref:Transposase n=1 Tax=Streptomyces chartreusis TaxID=1969 RepID=A0A7H8TA37_STRCX|nr:transposase [Streptomyces chartreusis]QKZ18820.1 transposase [Streptomyces chartreusis]
MTKSLKETGDIIVFADFQPAHWRKILSTPSTERLNREIKQWLDVTQFRRIPPAWSELPSRSWSNSSTTGCPQRQISAQSETMRRPQ